MSEPEELVSELVLENNDDFKDVMAEPKGTARQHARTPTRRNRIAITVTVTNISQASLGRPSPRALKPRLRYKLNHGVVGEVYYNLQTDDETAPSQ